MAQKTNTITQQAEVVIENIMPASRVGQDLKTAVLIISVVANLFVFTTWVALQVTTQFDAQIANFLFSR